MKLFFLSELRETPPPTHTYWALECGHMTYDIKDPKLLKRVKKRFFLFLKAPVMNQTVSKILTYNFRDRA